MIKTEVIILATLHQFHDSIAGYDFGILSEIIEALAPDVLAVELTPSDLKQHKEQKVKLFDALLQIWDSPAAVNSPLTDSLFSVKHALQNEFWGEDGWDAWNQHFLDVILQAAQDHAGQRLLVLVGAEHGYWLRHKLKGVGMVDLLDTVFLLNQVERQSRKHK